MGLSEAQFNEAALLQLCVDRAPESLTLEFKRSLPGRSDRDRAEFLKDVSALANAAGGQLVYGVEEKDGTAAALIPTSDEVIDDIVRRLSQVLDAGIEPRLANVSFHPVSLEGGYALIIDVKPSRNGPHRYLYNGNSRFVIRNGTHTSELNYDQLRSAFDKSASLAAAARMLSRERYNALANRQTWRPLPDGPICVAQFIPILSMDPRSKIDINWVHENFTMLMFNDWGGASRAFNLDGVVAYSGSPERVGAYTQVYRNGMMEAVRMGGHSFMERPVVPSTTVSTFYRDAISKYVHFAKQAYLAGPIMVTAALIGVDGHEFGIGGNFFSRSTPISDRSNMILPEIMIEDIQSADNVDDVARPILDILWQSFGLLNCAEYTEEGVWQPRT